MILTAGIFFILFLFIAWFNFRTAIYLFIILLPAYLVRFDFAGLPGTFLELSFGALFSVWLIRYFRSDWPEIKNIIKNHCLFFAFAGIFFLASFVSVFVSDMAVASLGQWRAYFLEPLAIFFVLLGRTRKIVIPRRNDEESLSAPINGQRSFTGVQDDNKSRIGSYDIIWALALSALSVSIYAIFQKFTGWGIATPEWTNAAARRVTAFFSSPNAVGLYLGPILALVVPHIFKVTERKKRFVLAVISFLAITAIVFTKSEGTAIGLAAALLVGLFLLGKKKIAASILVLGILAVFLSPAIKSATLFQNKSGENRLRLWSYTAAYLAESPKNFIFGAGIRQFFRKIQKPHYDDTIMERLIYPHNIFLNFWTETGLLGMLSAIGIIACGIYYGFKISGKNIFFGVSIIGSLSAIIAHGMVDVPYFKNDLAMIFWILIALALSSYEIIYKSKTDVA